MILPKLHITWERWRWNKEHQLFVSTLGNFMNKSKQPVKVYTNGGGYLAVKSRSEHPRLVMVHRIVLQTWKPIDNADEMTVDHLDHNKRNNSLKNLEWVTRKENMARAAADNIPTKVKTIIKASVIQRFLLTIDGKEFNDMEVALTYVKSRMNYLDAALLQERNIGKIFETLANAYKHQNPEYVATNFTKVKYNCEFSIKER